MYRNNIFGVIQVYKSVFINVCKQFTYEWMLQKVLFESSKCDEQSL